MHGIQAVIVVVVLGVWSNQNILAKGNFYCRGTPNGFSGCSILAFPSKFLHLVS